ncbi:hypothetical protein BLCOC_14020 [Blautia coccoides]|uniref:Uncharacterized protein n=1 Tax=Blautia producta TaxID=33035 RepID=A0ABZ0U755_9FIRM|nr:hypothetical protein EV205_10740 [Blautia coccoides]WPX73061.1 hypothetical protein BLCOC_14020 [Blautia coccoides]SUY07124.1 Uncharacterised protein [Blautia coccoides]
MEIIYEEDYGEKKEGEQEVAKNSRIVSSRLVDVIG